MPRVITPEQRVKRVASAMRKAGIPNWRQLSLAAGIRQDHLMDALRSDDMLLSTLLAVARAVRCRVGYLIDR